MYLRSPMIKTRSEESFWREQVLDVRIIPSVLSVLPLYGSRKCVFYRGGFCTTSSCKSSLLCSQLQDLQHGGKPLSALVWGLQIRWELLVLYTITSTEMQCFSWPYIFQHSPWHDEWRCMWRNSVSCDVAHFPLLPVAHHRPEKNCRELLAAVCLTYISRLPI